MTRFLLASPDEAFERRVRSAFDGALNGDLRRLAAERVGADPARILDTVNADVTLEVVLVGPGVDQATALELVRRFDEERPDISVVLVAAPSPELLEEAIRAGVRDVLHPDAGVEEIHTAISRASRTAVGRRRLTPDGEPAGPTRQVITVISPKGGAGKTTVAVNLAASLAQRAADQVVVVDLDLQFGDVAAALQLVAEHSMADAAASLAALDAMALKAYLTPHPSGLYALCAPDDPADGDQLDAQQVSGVLSRLSAEFAHVVIDTPAGLGEHTLSAIEASTDLVLVASMEVPSVRAMRKELTTLDALDMTRQRRHVVLNRADSKVGLEAADIEANLGLAIDVALPSSRAVPLSVNQGTPLVEADPRSAVARALTALSERFVPQKARRQGGLLSFMKGAR